MENTVFYSTNNTDLKKALFRVYKTPKGFYFIDTIYFNNISNNDLYTYDKLSKLNATFQIRGFKRWNTYKTFKGLTKYIKNNLKTI